MKIKTFSFNKLSLIFSCISLSIFIVSSVLTCFYISILQDFDIELFLISLLAGFVISIPTLFAAIIFYIFNFIFKGTPIVNIEKMKLIWNNLSDKEKKIYSYTCFIGGCYPAVIILPIYILVKYQWSIAGYSFLIFICIVLIFGIIFIKKYIKKKLFFIQEKIHLIT